MFIATILAAGIVMLVESVFTPLHAQSPPSDTPPPATNAGVQPTPAQRLMGDIAPKLADLTDKVLFGDVCNDAHRHSGGAQWEARGLDGEGKRRTIQSVSRAKR
jgi:hypothetical protein